MAKTKTIVLGGMSVIDEESSVETLSVGPFTQREMDPDDMLVFEDLALKYVAPAIAKVQEEMLKYTVAKYAARK